MRAFDCLQEALAAAEARTPPAYYVSRVAEHVIAEIPEGQHSSVIQEAVWEHADKYSEAKYLEGKNGSTVICFKGHGRKAADTLDMKCGDVTGRLEVSDYRGEQLTFVIVDVVCSGSGAGIVTKVLKAEVENSSIKVERTGRGVTIRKLLSVKSKTAQAKLNELLAKTREVVAEINQVTVTNAVQAFKVIR